MRRIPELIILGLLATGVAVPRVRGQHTDTASESRPRIPAHRYRLLGAFDAETGAPLADVEVLDLITGTKAVTSMSGTVSLVYLPEGGSIIRLRKLGYRPLTLFAAISPNDTVPITLLLESTAQVLPTVVSEERGQAYISPALGGFEERMRRGPGHFIDDSTLRAAEGEPMSMVLSRLAGATIVNGSLLSTRVAAQGPVLLSHVPGLTCSVKVYVDVALTTAPPNFDRQATDQYAGVEFYPSGTTAPIWISSAIAQCGVLLLWTRER